jgi:hypothetical protein
LGGGGGHYDLDYHISAISDCKLTSLAQAQKTVDTQPIKNAWNKLISNAEPEFNLESTEYFHAA